MPDPAAAPPADRAPRRRRGRPLFVLALLAAVLAGRGLGWFGGDGAPSVDPDAADAAPAAAVPPAPAAEPSGATTGAVAAPAGDAIAAAPPPTVPAPTPAADPVAEPAEPDPLHAAEAPPKAPAAAAGVDADRFHTLLSMVAAHRDEGQLGAALAALGRVANLPLDPAQREAVRTSTEAVEHDLTAACERVTDRLRLGEVLAARRTVAAMLAEAPATAGATVARHLGFAAPTPAAAPERGPLPWPVAAPLPRDRAVRTGLAGETADGRVVDGRSDLVTLRVETPHGVTFPTVPVVTCEPVEPTPQEATELGFAALQAGDPLLARLWLRCAQLRQDGDASARTTRLASLLQ